MRAVTLLLLFLLGPVQAEALDPALFQRMLNRPVTGGITGVVLYLEVPGQGALQLAAGTAGDQPIRPDDRFRIGSVSKMFVAVLVLQQVQQGRLKLDQRVGSLVPKEIDLPNLDRITIRQLLNHTSGLDD